MTKTNKIGVYYKILKDKKKVFYITYKDMSGKKIWLKIGAYNEGIRENICVQKRDEILVKLRAGETQNIITNKRIKREQVTLDEASEFYHKLMEKDTKEKNLKGSQSKYNRYIKPIFGKESIQSITEASVEKMLEDLEGKLAYGTINGIRAKMSAIINFAIKKREINFQGRNVIQYVDKYKVNQERTRYLESEEVAELLEKIKLNQLLYIFCRISLTTGARLETVLNINKKDINFKTGVLKLYDFKNKNNYSAFIKEDLREELKNFIKNKMKNDLIFQTANGTRITRHIQNNLKPIFDELFNNPVKNDGKKVESLDRVVIHTLRHTFASHLVINGVPIYTVKQLLNHKTLRMTIRYAHLKPDVGFNDVNNLTF